MFRDVLWARSRLTRRYAVCAAFYAMLSTLPRNKREYLLNDLCSRLGFCLPSAERELLIAAPPDDVDEFTDAVFIAEGMDPTSRGHRGLREQVRELVTRYVPQEQQNLPL